MRRALLETSILQRAGAEAEALSVAVNRQLPDAGLLALRAGLVAQAADLDTVEKDVDALEVVPAGRLMYHLLARLVRRQGRPGDPAVAGLVDDVDMTRSDDEGSTAETQLPEPSRRRTAAITAATGSRQ